MKSADAFQGLILQEFLLEDGLRNEFNYAEVASRLGELASEPAAIAVEHFLSGSMLAFINAGLTQQAIVHLVKITNTTLMLRATADFLAFMKSPEDNYKSCCRSALCHAINGSWDWAFGALRAAANKNDSWARHHHIYGLIHGAKGQPTDAIRELERAAATEPYSKCRSRILEAIKLVHFGAASLMQREIVQEGFRMANPWTVGYDDQALTAEEQHQLKAREDIFTGAFQASLYWTSALDGRKRRYLRALNFSNRSQCLGQFILPDIQSITDEERFKGRIIDGEFGCRELS